MPVLALSQARHCLVISDAQGLPDQQRDLGAIRFALPEVGHRGSQYESDSNESY